MKKSIKIPFEFANFIDVFKQVYKETRKVKKGKTSSIWLEHFNIWLLLEAPLYELYKENENYHLLISTSMFFIRFIAIPKQLYWLQFCAWSGAYHPLMRELRFILESCVQAYYIDKEHPDTESNCKFEILKEIENQRLIGAKLIEATDLEYKDKIKAIYSSLSKYVHSSPEEMDKIKDVVLQRNSSNELKEIISFAFDSNLLDKCIELTNKTMDIIYYIYLNLFPEIQTRLKQEGNVINLLKELDCAISKSYVEKAGE